MKRQAASPRLCLSAVVWICKLAWQMSLVGIYKQVRGSRCSSFPFLSQLQLSTTTMLWPSPQFVSARSLSSERGERRPRSALTGALTSDSPHARQLQQMCAVPPWCHCAFHPPTGKTTEPDLPGSVPKQKENEQHTLDGGRECGGLFCMQEATLTLASWRWEGQWPRGSGRSSTLKK